MNNLAEYFNYHPPETQKRRDAHNVVNSLSLETCEALFTTFDENLIDTICAKCLKGLLEATHDLVCQRWIGRSIDLAKSAAICGDKESTLMCIQQARMFANQGVTVDELKVLGVFDDSSEEHF